MISHKILNNGVNWDYYHDILFMLIIEVNCLDCPDSKVFPIKKVQVFLIFTILDPDLGSSY